MGQDKGNAIIVGASSGIGAALALEMVRGGYRVAILARRAEALAAVKRQCDEIAGKPGACLTYPHDVTVHDGIPELFQRIVQDLSGLDIVVYGAGVLPKIAADEYDFAKDRAIVETNLIGAMAWLDQAAMKFAKQGSGVVCGISSIAGDRGRKPYPAYHAAKAALSTFLESLRNRLAAHGVAVVTIKPGFIDTDMTRDLVKKPFVISAEKAASLILKHIEARAGTRYVPSIWGWVSLVIRSIPSFIFRRMDI